MGNIRPFHRRVIRAKLGLAGMREFFHSRRGRYRPSLLRRTIQRFAGRRRSESAPPPVVATAAPTGRPPGLLQRAKHALRRVFT